MPLEQQEQGEEEVEPRPPPFRTMLKDAIEREYFGRKRGGDGGAGVMHHNGRAFVEPECSYPKFENRVGSYPLITGDTFRAMADFVYDFTSCENGKSPFPGAVYFTKAESIENFLSLDSNRPPYVVVTQNSAQDNPTSPKAATLLDDPNLIAWFAQNAISSHPKMHPLPVGLANNYWSHGNVDTFDELLGTYDPYVARKYKMYLNLGETHPSRAPLLQQLSKRNWVHTSGKKSHREYMEDLKNSTFVFSPRGRGYDTLRVWESLLMGAVPVIFTDGWPESMLTLFEDLPVATLPSSTLRELERHLDLWWEQNSGRADWNMNKVFAGYWIDRILSASAQAATHNNTSKH
ncbi:hypothetical protein Pelo_961 [Pelomyxa schiedti]|nr:hypothetical protein Pelo_961 [Pelomyxa schiedti]